MIGIIRLGSNGCEIVTDNLICAIILGTCPNSSVFNNFIEIQFHSVKFL